MKRKIYLLLTLVLSLFVFSGRAEAEQVMYMECDYDEVYDAGSVGLGGTTYKPIDYNPVVIRVTDGETTDYLFCDYKKLNDYALLSKRKLFNRCWISNPANIDTKCVLGENTYNEGAIKGLDFDLNNKVCPASIRLHRSNVSEVAEIFGQFLIFAGKKEPTSISSIHKDEYIFYEYYSEEYDSKIIVGEGYTSDGLYAYVNKGYYTPNFPDANSNGNIPAYLCWNALTSKYAYWNVATNFYALDIFVGGYCSNEEDCKGKGFRRIVSSKSDDTVISEGVQDWYNDVISISSNDSSVNDLYTLINDEFFIKECDKLIQNFENGTVYSFSDGYTASELLKKLQSAYQLLKNSYDSKPTFTNYFGGSGTTIYGSAESFVMNALFGVSDFKDLVKRDDANTYVLNQNKLRKMLTDDIDAEVDSILTSGGKTALTLYDNLDNYNEKFLKTIAYFDYMSDGTDLSDSEKELLSELKKDMSTLGEKHNIFVVVTCDDLISEELNAKILSYFNIVKIIVQVLLVGLGIVDFAKAFFSGDDGEMKKAQKTFIKRIAIAILFFLIPTLINFLLYIANMVWSNINPNTCIRF